MPTLTQSPTILLAGDFATYKVHVHSPVSAHVNGGIYPGPGTDDGTTNIRINGVEYRLRADIVREGHADYNSRLSLGNGWSWTHCSLTRVDAYRNGRYDDSASDSARKKVREDLARIAALIPEEMLFEAGDVVRANRIASAEAQVTEAERKLAEARANLAALLADEAGV